jgi:hypothetical protein
VSDYAICLKSLETRNSAHLFVQVPAVFLVRVVAVSPFSI